MYHMQLKNTLSVGKATTTINGADGRPVATLDGRVGQMALEAEVATNKHGIPTRFGAKGQVCAACVQFTIGDPEGTHLTLGTGKGALGGGAVVETPGHVTKTGEHLLRRRFQGFIMRFPLY